MNTEQKKEEVKDLWRLCFGDTEEFIQLYFDSKYQDSNTVVYQNKQGNVLASLQMIPYSMTYAGDWIDTSYISGACTHPNVRNQGIMTHLLHQALQQMWERGILLTTLLPQTDQLVGFYQRLGFASIFEYTPQIYTALPDRNQEIDVACFTGELDNHPHIYSYFSSRMQARSCCVQHDKEDLSTIYKRDSTM